MKLKQFVAVSVAMGVLAGCDSGDVELAPTTVDNSTVTESPGAPAPDANPCASYAEAGTTFQGEFDGTNCSYDSLFVSDTRPITVDAVTFRNFGGLHIFADSLWVGEDVDANAAAGKRIPQEGEGTRVDIEAGSTMGFPAS